MATTKRIPWNKGKQMSKETKLKLSESLKGKIAWNKGIPCTDEHKDKLSNSLKGRTAWNKGLPRTWDSPSEFKKGHNVGSSNINWKEDVSYRNLHRWIERKLGKATKCEKCGKKEGRIHWSNNDHSYKRDISGWTQLCPKCHSQHDKLLK